MPRPPNLPPTLTATPSAPPKRTPQAHHPPSATPALKQVGPKLDGSLGLRGPRTQWLWVLYELSLSKVVDAGKVTLSLTATLTLIRRSASGRCY